MDKIQSKQQGLVPWEEYPSTLKEFLKAQGLAMMDQGLLQQALTHSSYSNERKRSSEEGEGRPLPNNQRLEYLGDSVLNLIVNEYLFEKFSDYPEGKLDKLRSQIICERTLAKIALQIKIHKLLLLGKGEQKSGGAMRPSNLADALEAVIAAIYLDCGFEITSSKVRQWFAQHIQNMSKAKESKDPKSLLQEFTQKHCKELPEYKEVERSGPEHRKSYLVKVLIQKKEYARSRGFSLKDAEQKAAKSALKKMEKRG